MVIMRDGVLTQTIAGSSAIVHIDALELPEEFEDEDEDE